MAENEALKLPKPLPGSDFLTFQADRRWDLLGFVKSDEIEEIKSCEVGQDGHRYYLIHWKDSWKPESSLIYCEKLLQDFWSKKSIIEQEVNSAKVSTAENTSTRDKSKDLSLSIPATATAETETVAVIKTDDTKELREENAGENDADVHFVKNVNAPKNDVHTVETEEQQCSNEELDHTPLQESNAQSGEMAVSDPGEKTNSLPEQSNDDTVSDSPLSKKGAPKRKARHPRQSVHSLDEKLGLPKRKERSKRIKEKAKRLKDKSAARKISKTVGTVIRPDSVNKGDSDVSEEDVQSLSNNLKCMVCDKHLSSEQNLMKHLLTHNNNHTCTICNKTFKSTHFLKHHMDKHNASYQYSCPVCDKKFKFKNNMRGHLRKHNMEKNFECEICQKKFIGRYNLKEHMKAHSDDRPFECDFCKKSYKDRGALNKHLLTHQEKKVQCEICKRAFTNATQVKRHMQFHYSWPGDSFKRKSNIGPNGEKLKHKCQHCGKLFNHYSNMNAHVHKKHIEKKIKCTECPKMFAYQYELREHMFIHCGGEGSKFKCQFCEKTFQRSTTLKNHERTTHLGIKRFKCEVCGKMFGTKFNMKVHVEKLHGNNADGQMKPKRVRASAIEQHNGIIASTSEPVIPPLPAGLPPVGANNLVTHPLLRNITTSDIIRNAMSHIPELGYFPPLNPHVSRAYQFYGMPPTDFGVS